MLPIVGSLIGAGASLAGGALNAWQTERQNRRSEAFSREMYDRTRADNLQFWNMQNEYNSPQAQMARFQAAGLNPNLIYGQGNSGPAGSIPTPDVQTPQFRTPEWGNALSTSGLGFMNAIYDLDIKQAQVDNLKAQNTVIRQDALLKAAQTSSVGTGEQSTMFDLEFKRKMEDVSAEARREQLRQLKTSTDLSLNRDAREAALNSASVQEAGERMLTMQLGRENTRQIMRGYPLEREHTRADTARIRESIIQMQKDGTLKDLDIALRRQGINPNDPMWSRIVGRLLTRAVEMDPSDQGALRAWLFKNFGR